MVACVCYIETEDKIHHHGTYWGIPEVESNKTQYEGMFLLLENSSLESLGAKLYTLWRFLPSKAFYFVRLEVGQTNRSEPDRFAFESKIDQGLFV